VRGAIRELDSDYGYLADPHTAIAYLGAEQLRERRPNLHRLFLATAHPAKFEDVVAPILGRAVPIPAPLAGAMQRPRQVVQIEPRLEALAELLEAPSP
jgi:threonine synthase